MKRLVIIILALCLNAGILCSCDDEVYNNSSASNVSGAVGNVSQIAVNSSNENSGSASSSDTFFEKTMFIKNSEVSDIPNYESIYKFGSNGVMTYSINIYEGFSQSDAQYFLRKFPNKNSYEIWFYYNGKIDCAKLLFVIDEKNKITYNNNSPTCFINESEFNAIHNFHTEWNDNANKGFDE